MRHALVAGAVAAAALLMTGALPRPAEALPVSKLQVNSDSGVTLAKRGGRGGGMGRGFSGGFKGGGGKAFRGSGGGGGKGIGRHRGGIGKSHFGGRRHRHRGPKIRIRPRYYGYAPYYYGYYDSYYGDECAWLKRKALRTGSGYWWRRYYDCRENY